MLGASRNTVREAVRALVTARVLDVRRGDGTYVTSLRPELLLEGIGAAVELMQEGFSLELIARAADPRAGGDRAGGRARSTTTTIASLEASLASDATRPPRRTSGSATTPSSTRWSPPRPGTRRSPRC